MKRTILCLLALMLSVGLLCTTALATEGETTGSYEVKLTHVSLDPANDALGYKAELVADEAVLSQVTEFGFELWVDGGTVVTRTKTENIQSTLTLRLRGILAAGGGEMNINGRAFVVIDGEKVYSETYTTTMKATVEAVNAAIAEDEGAYSKAQVQAVQALLNNNETAVSQWDVAAILGWQEKVSFKGGTYLVIAMAGDKYYALGSTASGGVAKAIDVTGEDGQIVTENAPEWNITVLDQYGNVTLTNAEGDYLWRQDGESNLYISGSNQDQWKVAVDAEGYYTLSNTDDSDSRYLSYSTKNGGFKAYKEANDTQLIQLMLIPTMPTVNVTAGEYAVVAVAGDKYYAMGSTAESGVVEATEVTVEDGMVTDFDTNKWNMNVLDQYGTVTLTNAEGDYLWRQDGESNLYISGSNQDQWKVAVDAEGYYTLSNTDDSDSRYLAYNGTGFKAYAEANNSRFIQFMLLPVKEKPVLTSGQYMVVGITKDGQKAMGTSASGGVVAARDLVYVNGEVFAMDPWTVTIGEDGLATFTNAAGQYLVSNSEDSNLSVGETETKWTVGVSEDGYFTFRNTHSDMRYLSYNGKGFKVYSNSSVQNNGYDTKFMMVAASGLQSGRYVVVAKAGDSYYAVGNSVSNKAVSAEDVVVDGQINTAGANVWTVSVGENNQATFTNAQGGYLVRAKSKAADAGISTTTTTYATWTVAVDSDGYYTFSNTYGDTRYLSYNGSGFKVYAAADEAQSRYIQFMLVPASQLESGKYAVVAQGSDGLYYAMTNSVESGVAAAQEVTVENGQLVTEGVDYWNVYMIGDNSLAVLTTADGQKLMRSDNSESLSNLVLGNTSHKWVVAYDAAGGYYTLVNVNSSDSRFLSYNGSGFKAYAAATDVRIIKLLLIPVE